MEEEDQNLRKEKLKYLEKEVKNIEGATEKAKSEMLDQFQIVTKQLTYMLNEKMNVMDDMKREQIRRLNREKENVNRNFQKELENPLPPCRKPVYQPPQTAYVYSEEFLEFHILGYFTTGDKNLPPREAPASINTFDRSPGDSMSHATFVTARSAQSDEQRQPKKVNDSQAIVFQESTSEYFSDRKSLSFHSSINTANLGSGRMWVCGWTKNTLAKNDTVLLNVAGPEYTVQAKKKKRDKKADQPTLMVLQGENILFAKKQGRKLFSFHLNSHDIKSVSNGFSIAALCCSKSCIYILSHKTLDFIQILDFQFQLCGNVRTFIEDNTDNCDFDMCLVSGGQLGIQNTGHLLSNHSVILCKSGPPGYVRKVDRESRLVWQIDNSSHPELTPMFEPCSVCASDNGDIFVADRGTDAVSELN